MHAQIYSMQGRAKERGISEVQVETRGRKDGERASQKIKDQERERQKSWRVYSQREVEMTEDERGRERHRMWGEEEAGEHTS